jgi:hypothetical protein
VLMEGELHLLKLHCAAGAFQEAFFCGLRPL